MRVHTVHSVHAWYRWPVHTCGQHVAAPYKGCSRVCEGAFAPVTIGSISGDVSTDGAPQPRGASHFSLGAEGKNTSCAAASRER